MFGATPAPAHVKAPPSAEDLEVVGGFAGFLRRPKSSAQGLTAQVFGENGPDADTITALHLTRYLDAPVRVTVWLIKDRQGRLQKAPEGGYRKLVEFIGRVRRPLPSMNGQAAQFFAENGPDADAVSALNQTSVLDALVYVEIVSAPPGVGITDLPPSTPGETLDALKDRLTPEETRSLKEQQRRSVEGMRVLRIQGFFRSRTVWKALGTPETFRTWLSTQPCNQPGETPCSQHVSHVFLVPGQDPWATIGFCAEHGAAWEQGNGAPQLPNPQGFLATRHLALAQRWTEQRLRDVLRVPKGYEPTPVAIHAWAQSQGIVREIPHSFLGLLV